MHANSRQLGKAIKGFTELEGEFCIAFKHPRDKNKCDESLPFHSLNFVKAEEQLGKNR